MVFLIALTEEVHVFISHTEYTQDLFVVRPDFLYGVWRRHMFAADVLSLIHSIMRRPFYLSAGLFCQNAPLPGFFLFVSFFIASFLVVILSWYCILWSTRMVHSDMQTVKQMHQIGYLGEIRDWLGMQRQNSKSKKLSWSWM